MNPHLPTLKDSEFNAKSQRQRHSKQTQHPHDPYTGTLNLQNSLVTTNFKGQSQTQSQVLRHSPAPRWTVNQGVGVMGTSVNNSVPRLSPMPPPKQAGGDQWAEKSSKQPIKQSHPRMRKLNLGVLEDKAMHHEVQTERGTGGLNVAELKSTTPKTARAKIGRTRTASETESTLGSEMNDFVVEPMTPAEAIRMQGAELTDHEKGEILDYPKVYYLGKRHCKQQPDLHARNRGFDDDKGEYHVHVGDHLGFRYEILAPLGKGSFGQVLKCLDHKTGSICAVKIVKNKRRFQAQALVEIKILRQLRDNDPRRETHTIHLKDNFFFRNHHCIVFPLHSLNLYDYMKSTNFEPMPMSLIRNLAVQIIKCLRYLRSQRIVHCDMKPENILLLANSKSKVSVIDFGSACLEDERVYTYIQSRFYRSPEVILGLPYGFPIDMWSFGCILAELFTSYPLFPGENEMDQMACIMEIKGLPPQGMIVSAPRSKMFFGSDGQPYIVENSRGKKRYPGNKSLAQALKCRDRDFIDFLSKCLEWEPHSRLTAEEALNHRWITGSSLVANSVGRMNSSMGAASSPGSGKHRRKKSARKADAGPRKSRHQQETFPPINLI